MHSVDLDTPVQDKSATVEDIISHIGFGRFQFRLLCLCGLGWFSDNMWLQAVSTLMPRVQQHFNIPDSTIGLMSSSIFIGMAVGAFFWGIFSDYQGRKLAFNLTLILSAVFGVAVCLAPQFWFLCVSIAFVGFFVGGNMPVDGALFLEFIPKTKQYLLTALSVFFSFGAVLAAILAWAILPSTSCSPSSVTAHTCNPSVENNGWRYVIGALAGINALMFVARYLCLRLEESPRFLLARGRSKDARDVLLSIVKLNMRDAPELERQRMIDLVNQKMDVIVAGMEGDAQQKNDISNDLDEFKLPLRERLANLLRSNDRLKLLFSRKWLRTTLLIWAIWILVAVAYTMFSSFLPIFLETRGVESDGSNASLDSVYRGYFIYCLFSIPGPLIGGWLSSTRLASRWTMAISTLMTGLSVFLFALVRSSLGMTLASAAINFFAYIFYAVIYSYTPAVFETEVRGTAVGMASSLGRIAGICAPALTGVLLGISVTLPMWVSVGLFAACSVCMLLLPVDIRTSRGS